MFAIASKSRTLPPAMSWEVAALALLVGLTAAGSARAGNGHEAVLSQAPDIEVTLVYPHSPDVNAAYTRVVNEVSDLVAHGDFRDMHINARAVTGQEYAEGSWQRIHDPDGGYVTVYYDPRTHEIRYHGKVLKQF